MPTAVQPSYQRTQKAITLAWTGASGAPYGLRLLECLLAADYQVYLLISSAARVVLATEEGLQLPSGPQAAHAFLVERFQCDAEQLIVCGKEDWFSPVASGSAAPKQMVVCPCSAGSVAAIAHGMSDNLIERAADVVLKERGQLMLVVRETPFSTLHLENMHKLSAMGVTIMPAAPGFYHQPQSIEDLVDFMVARVLDHLGIDQGLVPRWGYNPRQRPHT
ncbi:MULTISPECIES: flavin prenyltransferase UbiX [unclassified Vibrio]|uniref:Flavin prenyltransferase UbiX n=1 Tax=Vibrio sp. HB236076 TaxID=3232307 RepID=A0AB39HGC3_9VIBR|nr:flavin prenyltransferase UbiX [Vibrio sp. HB161653]MDP5255585.1 flavin prenyltransferase UbiX [Vibrio sp. HB161653]